jgi:hypothetical protein
MASNNLIYISLTFLVPLRHESQSRYQYMHQPVCKIEFLE